MQGGDYAFDIVTDGGAACGDRARPRSTSCRSRPCRRRPRAPVLDGVESAGEYGAAPALDLSRLWEGDEPRNAGGRLRQREARVVGRRAVRARRRDRRPAGHRPAAVRRQAPLADGLRRGGDRPARRRGEHLHDVQGRRRSRPRAKAAPRPTATPTTARARSRRPRPASRSRRGCARPTPATRSSCGSRSPSCPPRCGPGRPGVNLFIYDSDTKDKTGQTRLGWSTWGGVQGDPYRWGRLSLDRLRAAGRICRPSRRTPVFPREAALSVASPQSILQAAGDGVALAGGAGVAARASGWSARARAGAPRRAAPAARGQRAASRTCSPSTRAGRRWAARRSACARGHGPRGGARARRRARCAGVASRSRRPAAGRTAPRRWCARADGGRTRGGRVPCGRPYRWAWRPTARSSTASPARCASGCWRTPARRRRTPRRPHARARRPRGRPARRGAREALVARIAESSFGLGPLEPLLRDPAVDEILVCGTEPVWVERGGRLEATDARFASEAALRHVIERILAPLGRRVRRGRAAVRRAAARRLARERRAPAARARRPAAHHPPLPPARLRAGRPRGPRHARRAAARPPRRAPCAARAHAADLRRHRLRARPRRSARSRPSPIRRERIVTIEDAAELRLPLPHVVRLEARPPNLEGRGEVTIRRLVRNALRMRPDRIIVGEVRGPEALDLLSALTTGHAGSLCTIHAGQRGRGAAPARDARPDGRRRPAARRDPRPGRRRDRPRRLPGARRRRRAARGRGRRGGPRARRAGRAGAVQAARRAGGVARRGRRQGCRGRAGRRPAPVPAAGATGDEPVPVPAAATGAGRRPVLPPSAGGS